MKLIEVTDHALVRWMDREYDIDMERLRRKLAEKVHDAYAAGASSVVIDELRYVMRDGRLVTVAPVKRRGEM